MKKKEQVPPSAIVIDDDAFLLKGLDYGLRKLGIVPTLTEDPDEFLEKVASGSFDLHLIDLQLGNGRSGFDLIEKIRASLGPRPRLIMVSATGDTRTIAEALARGANDDILKPLDREHLAAKLGRYVMTQALLDAAALHGQGKRRRPRARQGQLPCRRRRGQRSGRAPAGTVIFCPKGRHLVCNGDLLKEISGDDQKLAAAETGCSR